MFNVDADKVEEALRYDVRFKTVHAEYKWPGVLHINVQERRPALYVENAYQGYAKIGYCGTVMDVTSGIPDDNAPMLTGVDCGSLYISDVVENKNVLSVLNFLNSIDITAHEQFTEIDIDKENNVKVQLKIGFPILLGPVAELKDKTELFMTVFNEIKGKKIVAEYIDLTYAKPYIRLKDNAEKVKK
jgi:cell division protein FtsQ